MSYLEALVGIPPSPSKYLFRWMTGSLREVAGEGALSLEASLTLGQALQRKPLARRWHISAASEPPPPWLRPNNHRVWNAFEVGGSS